MNQFRKMSSWAIDQENYTCNFGRSNEQGYELRESRVANENQNSVRG